MKSNLMNWTGSLNVKFMNFLVWKSKDMPSILAGFSWGGWSNCTYIKLSFEFSCFKWKVKPIKNLSKVKVTSHLKITKIQKVEKEALKLYWDIFAWTPCRIAGDIFQSCLQLQSCSYFFMVLSYCSVKFNPNSCFYFDFCHLMCFTVIFGTSRLNHKRRK